MISERQRLQIITREPKFIEKLQRIETLGIELSKLLGHTGGRSTLALGKSPEHPKERWSLYIKWEAGNIPDGLGEAEFVILHKRVKGWIRSKLKVVMKYNRDRAYNSHEEKRRIHMFEFDTNNVTELDALCDALEERIAEVAQTTEKYKEQFRRVIEEHPREEKNRFDKIGPLQ